MNRLVRFASMVLLTSGLLGLPALALAEEDPGDWEKMVFHLDDSVNARWALLLANAYLDDSPGAHIAIVAYGPGIDFLLEGAEDRNGNPYDIAISNLRNRGVDFRVCATTLQARGIAEESVLDDVEIVPSGLTEIARLQLKEGYAYLKP